MLVKDENGIIVQPQPDGSYDGGDSVNWMGHYIYLTEDKDNFPFVDTFEVGRGGYVRHPYPKKSFHGFGAYYKNPWDGVISRDQYTGILAGLIAKGDGRAILRALGHHALRLFLFSYNTIPNGVDPKTAKKKLPDLTLFDIWAMELRALASAYSWLKPIIWPVLCVLDLHMLVSTIFVNSALYKDEDVISYLIKLFVTLDHVRTPVGSLMARILNRNKMILFVTKYWCGWRRNCDMAKLYQERIIKL